MGTTKTIVAKFRDFECGPNPGQIEKRLSPDDLDMLRKLSPGCGLQSLYRKFTSGDIAEMVKRALSSDPAYRDPKLLTYFRLNCPGGGSLEPIVEKLRSMKDIEHAYIAPAVVDTTVNFDRNPRTPYQGYLEPAPRGVDAKYASLVEGGDGKGQEFIDLEQGWTLEHEDLVEHGAQLLYGEIVDASRPHGTRVLGVICAVDNAKGGVGIVPHLGSVNVVSHTGDAANIAEAITFAAERLSRNGIGGVLLLETSLRWSDNWILPVETDPAIFAAIELAVGQGVVVIEAAGNGGRPLDERPDLNGKMILNRNSEDFRDSGAIMVGSALRTGEPRIWTRALDSNFGSRIDCFASGDSVDTTDSGAVNGGTTTDYTHAFNGTSSAAAIIAGTALSVQGMAQASRGARLTPEELRQILSDRTPGTPERPANTPTAAPQTDLVGVMPNLKAISAIALQIQIADILAIPV